MIRNGILSLLIFSLLSACSVDAKNAAGTETPAKLPELPKSEAQPASTSTVKEPSNLVKWDEFFDDDKQNQPSQKFKDMNAQNVVIDGFMGEILSMGKGWFLLIPKPGAECPFDNGDQSYWNSIMLVFVKDKDKLRYTQGALRITGKLDVGARKDESGYTTMFRLYDAEYTKK